MFQILIKMSKFLEISKSKSINCKLVRVIIARVVVNKIIIVIIIIIGLIIFKLYKVKTANKTIYLNKFL